MEKTVTLRVYFLTRHAEKFGKAGTEDNDMSATAVIFHFTRVPTSRFRKYAGRQKNKNETISWTIDIILQSVEGKGCCPLHVSAKKKNSEQRNPNQMQNKIKSAYKVS
jgi:hypothetical protein